MLRSVSQCVACMPVCKFVGVKTLRVIMRTGVLVTGSILPNQNTYILITTHIGIVTSWLDCLLVGYVRVLLTYGWAILILVFFHLTRLVWFAVSLMGSP